MLKESGGLFVRLEMTLSQAEGEFIKAVLKDCGYNKTTAAKRLGIARATLYRKLAEHGITLKSFIESPSTGSVGHGLGGQHSA